ncbi:MAG: carbohydrate ABC transporter permease, partial [Defluviitaleaceae bacterium]|nr:carbohydrate ABC transporter permease [Defluviitaleaceae bacterium]
MMLETRGKKKLEAGKALLYICLGALAFAAIMPLIYTLANSFVGQAEYNKYYGALTASPQTGNPFHLIPERATLAAWYDMLVSRPDYLMKLWTSLGISAAVTAGQLIVSALGGYAFAKFRWPGRDFIFFVIIILMMMPIQVTISPNYMVLNAMGLIGSYWSVILPGVFSAFGIFLIRQFMAAIPDSLLESAKID